MKRLTEMRKSIDVHVCTGITIKINKKEWLDGLKENQS